MRDGEKIREKRQDLGLSITELAFEAGVSPSGLHKVESGKTEPRGATLRRLRDALQRLERKTLTPPTITEAEQAAIADRWFAELTGLIQEVGMEEAVHYLRQIAAAKQGAKARRTGGTPEARRA